MKYIFRRCYLIIFKNRFSKSSLCDYYAWNFYLVQTFKQFKNSIKFIKFKHFFLHNMDRFFKALNLTFQKAIIAKRLNCWSIEGCVVVDHCCWKIKKLKMTWKIKTVKHGFLSSPTHSIYFSWSEFWDLKIYTTCFHTIHSLR